MSSLKHHLSLIIPFFALLFSLESILLINRATAKYERSLQASYSLVIASKRPLEVQELKKSIREAKGLELISTEVVLGRLQQEISGVDINLIKNSLPQFYSLTLSHFPDEEELQRIEDSLKKVEGIERVESFARSHGQIYRLLLLLKMSITIFAGLIVATSFLLMKKQIEIWHFEHSERMEIMAFFGAPPWMRNGLLFRLALLDSLIAAGMVIGGLYYMTKQEVTLSLLASIELDSSLFVIRHDAAWLFVGGVGIAIVAVLIVIARQKD